MPGRRPPRDRFAGMADFRQATIGSSGPELLISAGDGPALIFNADVNNTVWLGNDGLNTVAGDQGSMAPLPPLATVVLDGTQSIYGIMTAGQTALVSLFPGGLNFFQLVELLVKTLLIAGSAGNGLYVYSGSPAPGDLVASIVPVQQTDPETNLALAGVSSYSPLGGQFVAVNLSAANQVSWFTAPAPTGPWTLVGSITADINGDLSIVSTNRIGIGNPLVALIGSAFEQWHTLGGLGTTGYTIQQGRFRYEAIGPGYCVLDIQLQAGAGGGTAGVYTWTIIPGAQYQFTGNYSRSYALGYNGVLAAGANAGSVLVDGAGTATPGRIRLDIPGLPANTTIGDTIWIPLS
jgi:hypothetical protein